MLERLRKRIYYHYQKGGMHAISFTGLRFIKRSLAKLLGTNEVCGKIDNSFLIVCDYPETLPLKPPSSEPDLCNLHIHWVIPDFAVGQGGHMVIFRIIRFLEQFGHLNTIWINGSVHHPTAEAACEDIHKYFNDLNAKVHMLLCPDDAKGIEGDAVIATDRWTAYPVRAVTRVRNRFYFVQDYEPEFYPRGSEQLLVQNTYRFGYTCITAGKWLKNIMEDKFKAKAFEFELAYDPEFYFVDSKVKRDSKRVVFYCRYSTPRRAAELGFIALRQIARDWDSSNDGELQIDIIGEKLRHELDLPCKVVWHGILDHIQLARLYRKSAVGVVFSTTNYSLVPQEMMACGLPVIDLDVESTRAVFPEGAVMFARPDPFEIAKSIKILLKDQKLRINQAKAAMEYINQLSWKDSALNVEQAIIKTIKKEI